MSEESRFSKPPSPQEKERTKSSRIVKLALTWVATTQSDAIKYRSCRLFRLVLLKDKCKPEGYHAVCVQYVALSCCLSAKQMAKSKQIVLLQKSVGCGHSSRHVSNRVPVTLNANSSVKSTPSSVCTNAHNVFVSHVALCGGASICEHNQK